MTVQVTNRNDFALRGRFNGRDYTFAPGKPTEAPEDAVRHIFGFGQDNHVGLIRLGLLKPGSTLETAKAALDKVQFTTGKMVFEQPEPAPEPARGPGKNEEPEDEPEESESGKASAQQIAPGGSTGVAAAAPAIPKGRPRKY